MDTRPIPVRRLSRRLATVVALTVTATVALCVYAVVRELRRAFFVDTWQASQFWITYSHGFVRRGLPGQLLTVAVGGPPTAAEVTAAAVGLSLVAAAALALLVGTLTRSASGPAAGAVVASVLVASPFTFSLLVRDVGRYDTIGIIAIAVIVLGAGRLGPGAWTAAAVVATVAAVAAAEFLVVFVVPVALVAVQRSTWLSGWRRTAGAAVVVSGVAVAAASVIVQPSRVAVQAAFDAATAARPDIARRATANAITALTQTPQGALEHLAQMSPFTLPALTLLFGGCFAVTIALLARLLGPPRVFWSLVGFYAAAAVGLSIIGIDYRRWWALAFVAAVATMALLGTSARHSPPPAVIRPGLFAMAFLVLMLAGQLAPSTAAWIDPAAPTVIGLDPG